MNLSSRTHSPVPRRCLTLPAGDGRLGGARCDAWPRSTVSRRRSARFNVFDEGKPMWQILLVFLVPLMLSNLLQSASADVHQHLARPSHRRPRARGGLGGLSDRLLSVFVLARHRRAGARVLIGQAFGARRPAPRQEDGGNGARRGALLRHLRLRSSGPSCSPATCLELLGTPATSSAGRCVHARRLSQLPDSLSRISSTRRFCAEPAIRRRRSTF